MANLRQTNELTARAFRLGMTRLQIAVLRVLCENANKYGIYDGGIKFLMDETGASNRGVRMSIKALEKIHTLRIRERFNPKTGRRIKSAITLETQHFRKARSLRHQGQKIAYGPAAKNCPTLDIVRLGDVEPDIKRARNPQKLKIVGGNDV